MPGIEAVLPADARERAELEVYARELGWILDQACASLAGLTAVQLNWRPVSHGTPNSAWAIAVHLLVSTRVYALGFGCGRPVERDRSTEFTGAGAHADEVIRQLRQLGQELDDTLAGSAPAALDERLLPPQELWGTGSPREVSRREALAESIRHAAIHLGELRLTRDLALQHV
jgi:hypothetical protein